MTLEMMKSAPSPMPAAIIRIDAAPQESLAEATASTKYVKMNTEGIIPTEVATMYGSGRIAASHDK